MKPTITIKQHGYSRSYTLVAICLQQNLELAIQLLNLLTSSHVVLVVLKVDDVLPQGWEVLLSQMRISCPGRNERKGCQDIRSSELGAAQVLSTSWSSFQLILQELEVSQQVRVDKAVGDISGDFGSDWLNEERYRRGLNSASNQSHHEETHQAALSIVHVILESHPLLSLAANLVFLSCLPVLWEKTGILAVVLTQILCDQATLCDDNWLREALWLEGYDWRLAEAVDLLQFWWCKLGLRVAMEDFNLIWCSKSLEEPNNALGAGCLKPNITLVRAL